MPIQNKRLGLSLSGGGYRAAAFHLGTLKKLNQFNLLDEVDVMSTISGGSITGAAWCLHEGDYLSFHEQMKKNLKDKSVLTFIFRSWIFIRAILFLIIFIIGAFILSLTELSWMVFPVLILFFFLLLRYQYVIFPVSKVIEQAYDNFFCKGKCLKDLKIKPLLAIGSSNLHTGRPFTFSRLKMSDSAYSHKNGKPIIFLPNDFPVSRAVMASSSVPFAFTPITIDPQFFANPDDQKVIKPVLVDGGVYDNQGIHKLTQERSMYETDIIITSDAGGAFMDLKNYPNVLALLIRTVDLFMYRIKAVQMVQHVYGNVQGAAKPIAYFSLGWRIENLIPGFIENMSKGLILPEVTEAHMFEQEWRDNPKKFAIEITEHLKRRIRFAAVEKRDLDEDQWQIARSTGTNLKGLTENQIDYLARHAENLTELQLKLYCPGLFNNQNFHDESPV